MAAIHGRWTLRGYGLLLLAFALPGAALIGIVVYALLTATYEESRNDALFVLIIVSPLLLVSALAATAFISLVRTQAAARFVVLAWGALSIGAALVLGYGQGTFRLIGALLTHPQDVGLALPTVVIQESDGTYYQDLGAAGVWAFVLWLFLGLAVFVSAALESVRHGTATSA